MVDIEMYYRDFCGFCARADRLLQSKNVEYRRINIWEVDGANKQGMAARRRHGVHPARVA